MQDWHEKAQMELEQAHENGELSDKEYQLAFQDLNHEYDEYAREAAEETYNSYY